MNQAHRIRVKLVTLVGLLSLLAVLWAVVLTPTASGYEISIYDAYPWPIWIGIAFSALTLFCALLVAGPFGRSDRRTFIPSAFTSLTSGVVLLLIPYFRGYALYGAGDTLTHLGYVRDILRSGHVSNQNVYPATHIFMVALTLATSVAPMELTFFLPPLFVVILLLGTFLLSRDLGSNKTALFTCALLLIPVLDAEATRESILPSFDAFCMMPLALHLLFKGQKSVSYTIAFVLLLGLLTVFHFEAELFLLVLFVAIVLASFYISRHPDVVRPHAIQFDTSDSARQTHLMAIILLAVLFIAWFSYLAAFGSTVRSVYSSFTSSLFEGPITSRTIYQPAGVLDASSFILRVYGGAIVYVAVAAGTTFTILFKTVTGRPGVTLVGLLLSAMLVASLALSFLLLLYGLAIGFSVTRILKYPLLLSSIMLGTYLTAPSSARSRRRAPRAEIQPIDFQTKRGSASRSGAIATPKSAVAVFVVAAAVVLVFNAYPNLTTHGFSYQITNADFSAMRFLFDHRSISYPIDEVLPRAYQTRFGQAFYGPYVTLPGVRGGYGSEVLPPPHFGYNGGRFLGAAYTKNQYLLVTALSRIYYPDVYPGYEQYWQFFPSDFQLLNLDPTVNRIYDDGGMQIFVVVSSS